MLSLYSFEFVFIVSYGPSVNSRAGTTREPLLDRRTTSARKAAATADRSSAGSAWHSDPPMVPRLRTMGSAMTFSASCRIV